MREIKFRGLFNTEAGKRWCYGYYIGPTGPHLNDHKDRSSLLDVEDYRVLVEDDYWIVNPLGAQIMVDKDSVGQYTGKKDKNGKEIYEGDIVLITPVFIGDVIGHIAWDSPNFRWHWRGATRGGAWSLPEITSPYRQIEVIGNIYENKEELIDSKKQQQ